MSANRFLPAIGWFIISLIGLCLPGSQIPKFGWLAVIRADKLAHIFLFFTLCFLFNRALYTGAHSTEQRKQRFFLVMLGGIAYGTIMEFVQKYWVANRSFEGWDIVADSAGCLVAYIYSWRKWG